MRAAPVCGEVADFSVVSPAGRAYEIACLQVCWDVSAAGEPDFSAKRGDAATTDADTCIAHAAKRAGLPRGLAPGPFSDDYHCLRKNENCTLP